jgi:hypothetical protein
MLKGDFSEAINFVLTFENRIDEKDLRKIILDIYRQKLYELIENPNEDELRKIFEKEVINYCSEDEFQELFNYLTFQSVNEIEGLEKWTVIKGRYECFEAIVPYLEMFNSVLRNEEVEEKLETILDFYYSAMQPKTHPQIDYLKDTFIKNRSTINQNKLQNSIEEELERKNPSKLRESENNEREKETIKNSIINMNLSGNYSQIKSKVNPNALNQPLKSNFEDLTDNKSEKAQLFPVHPIDKSSTFEKNLSNANPSSISDRRPRVNASLNGPMNRDKIDSSVKVDNFLKNDLPSEEASQISSKQKLAANASQLSQANPILNSSNLSVNSYSQMAKSKRENPSTYSNRQENPVLLSHLNEL